MGAGSGSGRRGPRLGCDDGAVRVLIAPAEFSGTLTAVEAARAIADGWSRRAPADDLDLVPMGDGGPGLVDLLHATLGGELVGVTVRGPSGGPVPGAVLRVGSTAWVESAQACGRALLGEEGAESATSWGVGELVGHAVDAGATRVVVGLRGSGVNDGGAGLLGALGATADRPLDEGVVALDGLTRLDLEPPRRRLAGITLVGAGELTSTLTGLFGTTKAAGVDRGIPEGRLPYVDAVLEQLAAATDRRTAAERGAGAGGGLGFALRLLGAELQPGLELVAGAVDLPARARAAELVVTGVGSFDFSSGSGSVPYGVATLAAEAIRPCVAVAGRVLVGSREMRALGVESAYAVDELVGADRASADPAGSLAELAERVARTWSR